MVKVKSYPTLCDPMDCSLPGSSIHGIFQARILEWVAISFFRRFFRPRAWTQVSGTVGRCFTVWTIREVRAWEGMVEIRHAKINDWTTHFFSYSTVWARSSGVLAPWPSGNNSEGMQLWSGLVVVGEVVYKYALCMHAKSLQLCLTPYNPMDCSPQGSSVHGILQARIVEWSAMSSSRGSSWPKHRTCVSYVSWICRQVFYH